MIGVIKSRSLIPLHPALATEIFWKCANWLRVVSRAENRDEGSQAAFKEFALEASLSINLQQKIVFVKKKTAQKVPAGWLAGSALSPTPTGQAESSGGYRSAHFMLHLSLYLCCLATKNHSEHIICYHTSEIVTPISTEPC